MKKVLLGLFVLLFVATLFAGASFKLNGLRAHDDSNGDIKIEWETQSENNVNFYKVERSNSQSFSDYTEFDELIPAAGSGSYYFYIDNSLFKANDYTFYYRIKIVDNDGTVSHSATISVTPKISGLKRTWGSIKAMFR